MCQILETPLYRYIAVSHFFNYTLPPYAVTRQIVTNFFLDEALKNNFTYFA